jgi:hypothetical protein
MQFLNFISKATHKTGRGGLRHREINIFLDNWLTDDEEVVSHRRRPRFPSTAVRVATTMLSVAEEISN